MTELSTAIHEAGHAVLSRYFGMTLECVAVSPACGLHPGDGATRAADQPSCNEDRAVIWLAGFVAECHHSPNAISWTDFTCSSRYAADRAQLDKVMQGRVPTHLDEDDRDEDELNKLIHHELERAKALVARPAIWRAITALSSSLVRPPHHLTGDEAMQIIGAELEKVD